VLCASPAYLAAHGTPLHPRELAGHAVIAYTYWAAKDEWHFDGPEGTVSVTTRPCIHANNGDTCRAAALAHQGIILQPSFLVGEDLAAGRLVELLPAYRSLEMGIYAVYPSRKHVPPKVRVLVDFLALHFAQPRAFW
jgi:DNA-binding transcriptional LysR family regulator